MKRPVIPFLLFMLFIAGNVQSQKNTRDMAVREDKEMLAEDDSWFYDDLDAALEAAAESKRPLMIVFR